MASFNGIEIVKELRPCIINGKSKALFHMWEQHSEIVAPSIMVGGHGGGVLNFVMGIVEDEKGRVYKVAPTSIKFVDNKIQDFVFYDEGSSTEEAKK